MEKHDKLAIHLNNLRRDIHTNQKLLDTYLEFQDTYKTVRDVNAAIEVMAETQAHINNTILSIFTELSKAVEWFNNLKEDDLR